MSFAAKIKRVWQPLAVLVVLMVVVVLGQSVLNSQKFMTSQIALTGSLTAAEQQDVYRHLVAMATTARSIDDMKVMLESVDWIHHVEVTRDWPQQLLVRVVKEAPIAYWNDDAFINRDGKVFTSDFDEGGDLAQLYGPVGDERRVMQQYQQLSNALLKSGQGIDVLALDERGGWQFVNQAGVQVLLGKDDIMERIQRYLQVVDSGQLDARRERINLIDTRYSNGLAVSWKSGERGLEMANNFKHQREVRL